jgi:hypothetical protein
MKTEDLIAILSTRVENVDTRGPQRNLFRAIILSLAVTIGGIVLWTGVRHDIDHLRELMFLMLKVGLATLIILGGALVLARLGRPGAETFFDTRSYKAAAPGLGLLAVAAILALPVFHLLQHDAQGDWLECLISIPVIAVVPFAAVVWAMRKMAPTNLRLTGAVTGLVAGGVSSIAYALHCTDDSILFITAWYGAAVAICVLAGALLGPRLLRW